MKTLAAVFFLIPVLARAGTIPFTATSSTETGGDGFAFNIPDLDGVSVNPDGSVNYNPLTYPPLPFDPHNPAAPVASGTSFTFGNLTYDASPLTGTGTETLPVTPAMITFDFSTYDHAFGYEVDVRPPTAGKSLVTLENIAGPGLTFVDGVPKRLDFTAKVVWQPTLFGTLKQTFTPYTGTLTVVNGRFTFALSDAPARWTLGTGDVHFYFDLSVTVPSLAMAVPPALAIARGDTGNVVLTVNPTPSAAGTFILQESGSLAAGSWENLGSAFDAASPPAPLVLPATPPARFFRLRNIAP